METLKAFFLGIVAAVMALFFIKRKPVSPVEASKEVSDKLDEIKEQVHDTDIADLVDKSNKRYPPSE